MADTSVVPAADLFGAALAANDRLKYYPRAGVTPFDREEPLSQTRFWTAGSR